MVVVGFRLSILFAIMLYGCIRKKVTVSLYISAERPAPIEVAQFRPIVNRKLSMDVLHRRASGLSMSASPEEASNFSGDSAGRQRGVPGPGGISPVFEDDAVGTDAVVTTSVAAAATSPDSPTSEAADPNLTETFRLDETQENQTEVGRSSPAPPHLRAPSVAVTGGHVPHHMASDLARIRVTDLSVSAACRAICRWRIKCRSPLSLLRPGRSSPSPTSSPSKSPRSTNRFAAMQATSLRAVLKVAVVVAVVAVLVATAVVAVVAVAAVVVVAAAVLRTVRGCTTAPGRRFNSV